MQLLVSLSEDWNLNGKNIKIKCLSPSLSLSFPLFLSFSQRIHVLHEQIRRMSGLTATAAATASHATHTTTTISSAFPSTSQAEDRLGGGAGVSAGSPSSSASTLDRVKSLNSILSNSNNNNAVSTSTSIGNGGPSPFRSALALPAPSSYGSRASGGYNNNNYNNTSSSSSSGNMAAVAAAATAAVAATALRQEGRYISASQIEEAAGGGDGRFGNGFTLPSPQSFASRSSANTPRSAFR